MEEQTIIEIWEIFKEYIPDKSRETAANQYVDFLVGQDVETETLESLLGYDSNLDSAIQLVLEESAPDEDDDLYIEDEEEDY